MQKQSHTDKLSKRFEKKITSFVPDNETLSKVDWVGIMLFMQKELAIQNREMIGVVDEVAKQFDAVRVNSGITGWAFPEHPHTKLRARENYEIAKVLKAFDDYLKALSSKEKV